MVLLEAMGTGLPVVSVDCETGPREIITDGVDGYVVPEDDTPALAAAMGELMGDAGRRRAFGAAALETAARYDAGTLGRRWERRIAELSAARRPGRGTMHAPALRAARAGAASIARRLLGPLCGLAL